MVESRSSVRAQQPLLTRWVVSIWIWKIGGIFPCIHNATVNDIKSNEKLFTQHEKSTRRMENCWWHLICGETATDTRLFKVQAHKSAVLQWRHMNAMSPISSLSTPGSRFQAAWTMPRYGDRCFLTYSGNGQSCNVFNRFWLQLFVRYTLQTPRLSTFNKSSTGSCGEVAKPSPKHQNIAFYVNITPFIEYFHPKVKYILKYLKLGNKIYLFFGKKQSWRM